MTKSTIDSQEVAKFDHHADEWWNEEGALKTLHDINPTRMSYIQQFKTLNGLRVLDVGCGGGILSEAMAKQGAFVTGIDASPESIRCAQAHASSNQLDINYQCIPIESFEAEHFDVITCMEMLEHVHQPQLVISHCQRLLKEGGYLFLSTINRTTQAYASVILGAEYILGLLPRQTHDYDKFIKPAELALMIRSAELELKGLSGLSYNPLNRQSSLIESVAVNYLMACQY